MGIRFTCPNGHRLHVKSFLAGKRGICPHCATRFDIPLADTGQVEAVAPATGAEAVEESVLPPWAAHQESRLPTGRTAVQATTRSTATTGTAASAEAAAWYVRPAGGGQYGPADAAVLQQWIREARVAADSLVWREDWSEWRQAGDVFAELAETGASAESAFVDVPDLSAVRGQGVRGTGLSPAQQGRSAGRRGYLGRTSRASKGGTRRLVVLLSLIVTVLAALLVFIVVYFGNG